MESSTSGDLRSRVEDRIRNWRVVVERTSETQSSFIAFGRRDSQPVVLKVLKKHGDEWRAGEILDAFEGRGVVQVYEYLEGAVLLERLIPGNSLVAMVLDGRDDAATDILAEVIGTMSPRSSVDARVPTVQEWAEGFERYAARCVGQIPRNLVEEAQRVYFELCGSQSQPRLLHGDLHHYNVLFDDARGWLAIDPKGVVGELEYEVGAALRNPYERPELFADQSTIATRVNRFASMLNLDVRRTLAWGFAQAVLSAIWAVEDGYTVEARNPWLTLANTIRPMLDASDWRL
jgi:streptomycin 6-kinase